MTRNRTLRRPPRRAVVLSAAVVALTALAPASAEASPASSPAHSQRPQQTRVIATSVLGMDYKFTLTALRSTVHTNAATVRLHVFVGKGAAWKESDSIRVGKVNAWFWFPLTGRHAVREFSTASTEPAPVGVSLLITPSIGYSPTFHYLIRHGHITRG
jgi:hypothetical protein